MAGMKNKKPSSFDLDNSIKVSPVIIKALIRILQNQDGHGGNYYIDQKLIKELKREIDDPNKKETE